MIKVIISNAFGNYKKTIGLTVSISVIFIILNLCISFVYAMVDKNWNETIAFFGGELKLMYYDIEYDLYNGSIIENEDLFRSVINRIGIKNNNIHSRTVFNMDIIANNYNQKVQVYGVDSTDKVFNVINVNDYYENDNRTSFWVNEIFVNDFQLTLGDEVVLRGRKVNGRKFIQRFTIDCIFSGPAFFKVIVDRRVLNEYVGIPIDGSTEISLISMGRENTQQIQNKLFDNLSAVLQPRILQGIANRQIFGSVFIQDRHKDIDTGFNIVNYYTFEEDVLNVKNSLNIAINSVFGYLVFIILLGIINTNRIIIREKAREIGTLRALGTSRRKLRIMLSQEAVVLPIIGLFISISIFYIIAFIIGSFEESSLALLELISQQGRVQLNINFAIVLIQIFVIWLVISFSVSREASKVMKHSPAHAIRMLD